MKNLKNTVFILVISLFSSFSFGLDEGPDKGGIKRPPPLAIPSMTQQNLSSQPAPYPIFLGSDDGNDGLVGIGDLSPILPDGPKENLFDGFFEDSDEEDGE